MITSSELRAKYIEFFVERNHVAIPSASLVPANDPTVLFTTAGMHPLVPNLLGEPHPAGARLVNCQKCIRTGDIDEIGDATHLSCFEMLGNWSLGDYFRDEAIRWSFAFLTERLQLPIERLGVTCFAGDGDVPRDDDSARLWRQLGIRDIRFLGRDDNWWGPAGKTGPCGPDTEIFFDGIEIWNNVFMGFSKTATGIEPLARHNVDTGMGLERTLVALNGLASVYEVDTVAPILDELRALATQPRDHELRVMTDHVRTASMAICDGVVPSNKDRGYVVRRLLRRSILFAQRLGMPDGWHAHAIDRVAAELGEAYPELVRERSATLDAISDEITRFSRTLAQGLKVLAKHRDIDAFDLFQTYGFPIELTIELAEGRCVDRAKFDAQLAEHREKSRGSGTFEGGLADHSEQIVRYHTLTHLLQAALRRVLGDHVIQRGSNITRERLRFDFSHEGKPAAAQLADVESLVNGWIARDLVVERTTMAEREARALGAIGAFGEKYGEIVSVYTIRDVGTGEVVSREFCGGPHVREMHDVRGRFRILREQALASGIRRIKAVLE
jgi:alanyl-tRNA synthetase